MQAQGAQPTTNCDCPEWCEGWFAIISLLNQPVDRRIFYPKTYLSAMHEVWAVTLVLTWLITLIFKQEQITLHPAKVIIGSFNPCFGWDYPPASNIALSLCAFNVYFGWRYVWLKLTRINLLNEPDTWVKTVNKVSSISLALSCNFWLNLWIIGPTSDPVGHDPDGPEVKAWAFHTGIFVFYAASAYLAVLANYLDVAYSPRSHVLNKRHLVFVVIYGASVFYLTLVYGYNLVMYEVGKPPALGSGFFTQIADFFWIGCVATCTGFLPPEPPLRMITEVVEEIDGKRYDEEALQGGGTSTWASSWRTDGTQTT